MTTAMADLRINDWIRLGILRKAGLAPTSLQEAQCSAAYKMAPSLDTARRGRPSPVFARLRHERLVLGTYRYELYGRSKSYAVITSAIARVEQYQQDGNLEHLVDAANLVAIEWLAPTHPDSRWVHGDLHLQPAAGADEIIEDLQEYSRLGYRDLLTSAYTALEDEFLHPTVPGAVLRPTHRGEPGDVGGVKELTQ